MTQLVDVVLPNYAAAAQTFAVNGVSYQTGVTTWLRPGASFDAAIPLTFSIKLPDSKSTRTRIKAQIKIPIMDPVLTTKKIDELIGEITFSIPKTATLVQRQDLRTYLCNFQLNDVIINAVEQNQGAY